MIPTERSLVVLSGCGTSGRLAFFIARKFNKLLHKMGRSSSSSSLFRYLNAGGDKSIIIPQEGKEDDAVTGANQLRSIAESYSRVLYIGITCGISAPYVLGQVS